MGIIFNEETEWLLEGRVGDLLVADGYELQEIARIDYVTVDTGLLWYRDRWVLVRMWVDDDPKMGDGQYWLYFNPDSQLCWEGDSRKKAVEDPRPQSGWKGEERMESEYEERWWSGRE